jgi:alpha-D-ribose 1-methylphosphonate 5-triphosphate diphosphatase PhnM
LKFGDRMGSIEEGKVADLIAFRPQTAFGYVTRVWVDGIQKLAGGL